MLISAADSIITVHSFFSVLYFSRFFNVTVYDMYVLTFYIIKNKNLC